MVTSSSSSYTQRKDVYMDSVIGRKLLLSCCLPFMPGQGKKSPAQQTGCADMIPKEEEPLGLSEPGEEGWHVIEVVASGTKPGIGAP